MEVVSFGRRKLNLRKVLVTAMGRRGGEVGSRVLDTKSRICQITVRVSFKNVNIPSLCNAKEK